MRDKPANVLENPRNGRVWSVSSTWRRVFFGAVLLGLAAFASGHFGVYTAILNTRSASALAGRDLQAAERWLKWSSRFHCSNAETELLRARLARRQNQLEDMQRHLVLAQSQGAAVERLEREQWLAMAQAGMMREAEPHLQRLLLDPREDGAEICEAYAIGYLLTYQINRVDALLNAWTSDFPQDERAHLIRARLFVMSHAWREAQRAYRRTLELDPACSEALRGLADVLVTQQRPEEALEWYRRVPAGSPHAVDANVGAADCLVQLDRSQEARELLSELVAAHPQHPQVLQALGRLELEAGNSQRAAELLRVAYKLQPNDDEILFALAAAIRGLGETDQARRLRDDAERIRKSRVEIARLQAIVVKEPENVEARYRIGMLLLEIRAQKDALIWLRSVLQIEPAHAGALDAIHRRPGSSATGSASSGALLKRHVRHKNLC